MNKQLAMPVYQYGFAMIETMLYLDTHPDDTQAIEYFNTVKEKYHNAVNKYSEAYGPLNVYHIDLDDSWKWIETPMPWELEAN